MIRPKIIDDIIDTFPEAGEYIRSLEQKQAGRPKVYGYHAKERVAHLRSEGYSIREIARKLLMSTTTVQKLLK